LPDINPAAAHVQANHILRYSLAANLVGYVRHRICWAT